MTHPLLNVATCHTTCYITCDATCYVACHATWYATCLITWYATCLTTCLTTCYVTCLTTCYVTCLATCYVTCDTTCLPGNISAAVTTLAAGAEYAGRINAQNTRILFSLSQAMALLVQRFLCSF